MRRRQRSGERRRALASLFAHSAQALARIATRIAAEHKEYQNNVAKLGKAVDKAFQPLPAKLIRPDAFEVRQRATWLDSLSRCRASKSFSTKSSPSTWHDTGAQRPAKHSWRCC